MIRHLWPIGIGFSLWALAFVVLYGLQHLGCRMDWDMGKHRSALVAAYGVATAALILALLLQIKMARRQQATALDKVGLAATATALAAAVVIFSPVLVASMCV